MKEKFLNHYISFIENGQQEFSSEQIEKMRYGIEGIYLTITKLVIIFLLGLYFHILKEILILLLFYNILRFFGFGYHAKGSKECLIFSITFFVILPLLVTKELLVFRYKIIVIGLCLLNFLLFAPSDTKKRPMINKKKKLKRKISILIVSISYACYCLSTNNQLSSLILLSIVIESIMVNPIIYWITREPYANYKNYLKRD